MYFSCFYINVDTIILGDGVKHPFHGTFLCLICHLSKYFKLFNCFMSVHKYKTHI